MVERDGAILRLIYTFEAIWKACQQLLAEREGIEVASPNATIRAARRLSWLSDEDAQAAIRLGRDRNLASICIAAKSAPKSPDACFPRPCSTAGWTPFRPGSPREPPREGTTFFSWPVRS